MCPSVQQRHHLPQGRQEVCRDMDWSLGQSLLPVHITHIDHLHVGYDSISLSRKMHNFPQSLLLHHEFWISLAAVSWSRGSQLYVHVV